MPLSLALHLYRLCQNRTQKEFKRDNTVLSQDDIETLIKDSDFHRSVRIFHSAVVDHAFVDGRKYHLNYLLNPVFYHDGFKRAAISLAIAQWTDQLDGESLAQARAVLDHLVCAEDGADWCRIFARHALGRLAARCPDIIDDHLDSLRDAFAGSAASVLSALVFCDIVIDGPKGEMAQSLIRENIPVARYRPQKEMMFYYLFKSPHFPNPLQTYPDVPASLRAFLKNAETGFTSADFTEGLKVVGLLSWGSDVSLWRGTPHFDTVNRIRVFAGDLIGAAGAAAR